MKIKEFIGVFEEDFPKHLAFDGDNVGLLVGDEEDEIKGILTTCDVDLNVVGEAVSKGANLIMSHHPLMFNPIRTLSENVPQERTLRLMISNGISLYTAHTNLDTAVGGLNDYMASLLKMHNCRVIDVVHEDEKGPCGYGRVCDFENPITQSELMKNITEIFGADGLRYTGDLNKKITRLGVNTGGGAGIIDKCIELGCDALITGDVKYNAYRDAIEMGMSIIDLMHYDSEQIAKTLFFDYISSKNINVPVYKSTKNVNVVKSYNA